MGKELYDNHTSAKELIDQSNDILGFDIKSIMFTGSDEELKQTSVYGIKVDAWNGKRNWMNKADQAENGEWPDLDPKWFDYY